MPMGEALVRMAAIMLELRFMVLKAVFWRAAATKHETCQQNIPSIEPSIKSIYQSHWYCH